MASIWAPKGPADAGPEVSVDRILTASPGDPFYAQGARSSVSFLFRAGGAVPRPKGRTESCRPQSPHAGNNRFPLAWGR